MPLAQLLQSLTGTCGQKTGILQRTHLECRQTHQAGFQEMVQVAAQAASAHTFNEAALRQPSRPSPSAPAPPARTSTAPLRRGSYRRRPRDERRHHHP